MRVSELRANPANPNRHSPEQIELYAAVIRAHGWRRPVTVSTRSGLVVRGHGAILAAQFLGADMVPVERQAYDSEAHELADLLADNRLAQLADLDDEAVAKLLQQISGAALPTGYDDESIAELLARLTPETAVDAPARIDEAAALAAKWQTAPGQIWQLGAHRLACGDCTDPKLIARLMGGVRVTLGVTDPPYGVDYDANWRNEAAEAGLIDSPARRVGKVENDDRVDWAAAWALLPVDVVYCWHAGIHASEVQRNLEAAGFEIRAQIIWRKAHFAISRGHYHWQHEPCWYAVRKGCTASWIGDRKQTTVWDIALDANIAGGHSTQKPLECMARPMRHHMGNVFDGFLGSGTTLIAAENLGRTCYGCEISPGYVGVILQRYADAFPAKPIALLEPAAG